MKIDRIVVGAFGVNCYILSTPASQAVVIDPGGDQDAIVSCLKERHAGVSAYWITHGHIDHLSALSILARDYPAPIYIHDRDAVWAFHPVNAMPPYYDAPVKPRSPVLSLQDGQVLDTLASECRVIGTPGHSPGSVCFHFPAQKMIFTGDTLFAGSVGRTDLAGGNEEMLSASLRSLSNLPEETAVYPGHGPSTTIAHEKRNNPHLPRQLRTPAQP